MLGRLAWRIPHGFFSRRLLSAVALPASTSTSTSLGAEDFLHRMTFFSNHQQAAQVVQQYIRLRDSGIRPVPQMFPLLLEACEQTNDAALAVKLYQHMEMWQLKDDLGPSRNSAIRAKAVRDARLRLIRTLCNSGSLDAATDFLKNFEDAGESIGLDFLNPVLSLIAAKDLKEMKSEALAFYEEMKARGLKPDTTTIKSLFTSQQEILTRETFEMLQSDMETYEVEKTPDLQAQIAAAYAKIGQFKQGMQLMEQLVNQHKDNISLRGLAALESLVRICRSAGELRMVAALVEYLVEVRGNPTTFGIDRYTSLAKICRQVVKKENLLQANLRIPVKAWHQMIDDITSSPLQPTLDCYSSLLALQVQLSLVEEHKRHRKDSLLALKEGEQLLSKMRFEGFTPSLYIYNILLHGYASLAFSDLQPNERLTRALKVLESMKAVDIKPNVHTYTSLFNACLPPKPWSREIDTRLFDVEKQMRESGVAHDVISSGTFTRVLGAGGQYGKMFEGFRRMRREGVPRNVVLYNALLHSAKENPMSAIRAMSIYFDDTRKYPEIRPDYLTIRWLLECCITTKKVRLAEWIVSTYARDVGVAIDMKHLNALLTLLIKTEASDEQLLHVITHKFPDHGIKLNRTTLKIILAHYCLTKNDLETAKMVLSIFEKKGKLKRDGMVVDLLVRGHLLAKQEEEALELLRSPECDKRTFRGILTDFASQKSADSYRTAQRIFEVLAEQNGARWGDEAWFKRFEQQYAM